MTDDNPHQEYLGVVRAEIAAVQALRAEVAAEIKALRSRDAGLVAELNQWRRVEAHIARQSGHDLAAPSGEPHGAAITRAIQAAGRPLRLVEIVAALLDAGHPLPAGRDSRLSTVFITMSRSNRFERVEGKLWRLTDPDPERGRDDARDARIERPRRRP